MVVCTGVTWLCERPWSKSILHITSKRPYKLCWGGLGFLPGFCSPFVCCSPQSIENLSFILAWKRGKKSKTSCGTGHSGARLVGVHDCSL